MRHRRSRIPAELPLDRAALLACGVITGFGAVVNTAEVEPGASVVVIGTGGVGLNAVQGAVHAGATTVVAIDLSRRQARDGPGLRRDTHGRLGSRGRRRRGSRAHRRARRRLRHRHGRGRECRRAGRADAAPGGHDGDRRHACRGRAGDDRPGDDRQRRATDPRQQDGLGPDRRSTSRSWWRSTRTGD